MRSHYEHEQQKTLFQWRNIHKQIYPQLKWMYAVPNGYSGDQSKILIRGKLVSKAAIQTNRMKAEGLTKGVLDICLPWPMGKYHGMYIEMKSPGKDLTTEQEEFIRDNQDKYLCVVCYDWIEARDQIVLYIGGERF